MVVGRNARICVARTHTLTHTHTYTTHAHVFMNSCMIYIIRVCKGKRRRKGLAKRGEKGLQHQNLSTVGVLRRLLGRLLLRSLFLARLLLLRSLFLGRLLLLRSLFHGSFFLSFFFLWSFFLSVRGLLRSLYLCFM